MRSSRRARVHLDEVAFRENAHHAAFFGDHHAADLALELSAETLDGAARTEQYWCPIKHDRRTIGMHARYAHFLDYGDPADFHEIQARLRIELSCEDCQSLNAHPVTKEPNQ